jgi:GT2 family glycosyltransferase
MKSECIKIKALLPYYHTNKEQEEMTNRARKSLMSFEHCLKVYEDGNKYETKVAGVWNVFFKQFVGTEYDYLLITANDVEHDPMMVDFMVRCAEENPKAGIISCLVTRDYDDFKKGFGQQKYTSILTTHIPKDPATFLLRKGVIEKIGLADEQFPGAFVERDLIYRAKLAGYEWVQPHVVLEYHPPYSGTLGNDVIQLQKALERYRFKWGNDADMERFTHPYNDMSLDYTYCER